MILMYFGNNPIFDGKMGVAATVAPKGQIGPMGGPFGLKPLSRKTVCKNFWPEFPE